MYASAEIIGRYHQSPLVFISKSKIGHMGHFILMMMNSSLGPVKQPLGNFLIQFISTTLAVMVQCEHNEG